MWEYFYLMQSIVTVALKLYKIENLVKEPVAMNAAIDLIMMNERPMVVVEMVFVIQYLDECLHRVDSILSYAIESFDDCSQWLVVGIQALVRRYSFSCAFVSVLFR